MVTTRKRKENIRDQDLMNLEPNYSLSQETGHEANMSSRARMSYQKWRGDENKLDKATTTFEFGHILPEETKAYGSVDLIREKALKAEIRVTKSCFTCNEQGNWAKNCIDSSEQPIERQNERNNE